MQPRLLKHPARLAGASLLRLQDDARLVALAREGHDPAFAAIVTRYGPPLERYCARLLGPGRAEDAVQQAFVNAHAAMKSSDQELALKPWLYRIAHNAALNILRAAKDEGLALDEDRPALTHTAEIVELRERLRETFAGIQALPVPQRDALLLRELEGRSHEEIALVLGVTEGGARQHLHRARVSLRAAASAITPYPVLTRVLTAAADSGARGSDLVSGAGLGVGAGAMKAAAGVLAAGAIAGGAAVTVHHQPPSKDAVAQSASSHRSSTAGSDAIRPSAGSLTLADDRSAGVTSNRGRGRGSSDARGHRHGSPGRRSGHHGTSEVSHGSGSGDDSVEQHSSTGTSGTSGDDGASHHSGSGTSGSGSSGSGSGTSGSGSHDGSGSGSGGGSDDTSTLATTEQPSSGSGSGSSGSGSSGGSDDGLASGSTSSGPDGGGTSTTTTTTTDGGGSGSGGSSGSDDGLTSGH